MPDNNDGGLGVRGRQGEKGKARRENGKAIGDRFPDPFIHSLYSITSFFLTCLLISSAGKETVPGVMATILAKHT